MRPTARQERILAIIAEQGRASVEALADLLGTSRETVRRDLTLLGNRGLLRKVHGGATRLNFGVEDSFTERMQFRRAEKLRIGRAAADLFTPGNSLLVDTGSTTIYFAEALKAKTGLTVVTNSSRIAQLVAQSQGSNEIYQIGGRYTREGDQSLGPLALEQIRQFRADHAVLTIGAVDSAGRFMDYDADEASVARLMMACAERTTILVDESKLGRTALFPVCDAGQVDRIVTNAQLPGALAHILQQADVEVIQA